jgi:hypothetical protein
MVKKYFEFKLDEKNTLTHVWGDIETLTEDLDRVEGEIEDMIDMLRFKLEKQVVLQIEVKKWDGIPW